MEQFREKKVKTQKLQYTYLYMLKKKKVQDMKLAN